MSIWQFNAAVEGYVAANSPKPSGALSIEEKNELADWIEAGSGARVLTTERYWLEDGRLVPVGPVQFRAG